MGTIVGFGAAGVILAVSRPAAVTVSIVVAAAIIVVAAALAFVRKPADCAAASTVDKALQANDCIVTAVECVNSSDAVSELVLRDATRRLNANSPAAALPIEVPARILASALGMLLIAVTVGMWRVRLGDASRSTRAEASRSTRAEASRSTPVEASRSTEPSRSATPETASGATATPSSSATAQRQERRDGVARDNSGARGNPGSPRVPNESAGDQGQRRGQPGDGRGLADSPETSSAMKTRNGGRAAEAGRGGGGVGIDSPVSTRSQTPALLNESSRRNSPAYATAWRDAQSAVARERIPADRRRVVRDYFLAIRPQQQ